MNNIKYVKYLNENQVQEVPTVYIKIDENGVKRKIANFHLSKPEELAESGFLPLVEVNSIEESNIDYNIMDIIRKYIKESDRILVSYKVIYKDINTISKYFYKKYYILNNNLDCADQEFFKFYQNYMALLRDIITGFETNKEVKDILPPSIITIKYSASHVNFYNNLLKNNKL